MARDISYAESVSIQKLLQQERDQAVWVNYVKHKEKKSLEDRILLVGAFRVYLIKPGGKPYKNGHYLDLATVTSAKKDEVVLSFKSWEGQFVTDDADDIINAINTRYTTSFPGLPADFPGRIQFKVKPSERLEPVAVERGPCDSFAITYASISSHLGLPPRDDIIWDVNSLLSVNQIKDFMFGEFEDVKDYRPLLGALGFNTYFKTFRAINVALEKKVLSEHISECLSKNTTIEELRIVNVSVAKNEFEPLFVALLKNKGSAITKIDVSANVIDDKGLTALGNLIAGIPHGLDLIKLSKCDGKKKGVGNVVVALKKNTHLLSSLNTLCLNDNEIADSGSTALSAFLAMPNALRTLNLANTSIKLQPIASALPRGCANLTNLDISGNKISTADVSALGLALQSSEGLQAINLNNTKLPVDGLNTILDAISNNIVLNDFRIDLAGNNFGDQGARILAAKIPGARNVGYLDISDNDLGDEGVEALMLELCASTTLKSLVCDVNMKAKGSKTRYKTMEAICQLLESSCPLVILSLAGDGGKRTLGQDLLDVLDGLGGNSSLRTLCVHGNCMGDRGAFGLSKALQLNDTLAELKWDGNNTTLAGLTAFKTGLSRNYTLKRMEIPLQDINAATKSNHARVAKIIEEITGYLLRNQKPKNLQGGTVGSGALHVMNAGHRDEFSKLAMKLRAQGNDALIKEYAPVLKDVDGHESVMGALAQAAEGTRLNTEDAIGKKLKEMSTDLHDFLKEQSDKLSEDLAKQFGAGFSTMDESSLKRLKSTLEYEGEVSQDAIDDMTKAMRSNLTQFVEVAYASMMEMLATRSYEHLRDQLEDGVEAAAHAKAAAEQAAKPKKAPPKVPKKTKAETKQSAVEKATSGATDKPTSSVSVAQVEKTEKPLQQLTKTRVAGPKKGRRPPTRRPRNQPVA